MKTTAIITEFLKSHIPDISGIYIFGSFADNTMRADSDIDVAFLSISKIDPVKKWKIQEKLASKLNRDVDLVDVKDASVILRTEIVENGKRIYTGNNYDCDHFEMTTYSLYADLNESRADILNDFKKKYGRDTDQ